MKVRIWIYIVLALCAGFSVATAQTPAVQNLPDWVAKYASGQEAARRACEISLAQEQDKNEKIVKELADAKTAAAVKK